MHNQTEVFELKNRGKKKRDKFPHVRRYHGRAERVRDRRDRRVSLVRLSELRLPVKEGKVSECLLFVGIHGGRRTPCSRVIVRIVVV